MQERGSDKGPPRIHFAAAGWARPKINSKVLRVVRFLEKKSVGDTSWTMLRHARFAPCIAARHMSAYVRTKPHMNIGTIGHVDHGKTTRGATLVNFGVRWFAVFPPFSSV